MAMASAPPSPARPLPSAKVSENARSTSRPSPRAMRWLSTAARTCAPKRVHSNPATSARAITTAPATRNSRNPPRRPAHEGRHDEGRGQRREKRPARLVDERHGDVAPQHAEAAMREVDEVHHPQRDREAHREQKKQHPVGEAVEYDTGQRPPPGRGSLPQ